MANRMAKNTVEFRDLLWELSSVFYELKNAILPRSGPCPSFLLPRIAIKHVLSVQEACDGVNVAIMRITGGNYQR
jgi:hypothetical protein